MEENSSSDSNQHQTFRLSGNKPGSLLTLLFSFFLAILFSYAGYRLGASSNVIVEHTGPVITYPRATMEPIASIISPPYKTRQYQKPLLFMGKELPGGLLNEQDAQLESMRCLNVDCTTDKSKCSLYNRENDASEYVKPAYFENELTYLLKDKQSLNLWQDSAGINFQMCEDLEGTRTAIYSGRTNKQVEQARVIQFANSGEIQKESSVKISPSAGLTYMGCSVLQKEVSGKLVLTCGGGDGPVSGSILLNVSIPNSKITPLYYCRKTDYLDQPNEEFCTENTAEIPIEIK